MGKLPLVDVKRRLRAFIKGHDERLVAVQFATRSVNTLAALTAIAIGLDAEVAPLRAQLPR